MFIILSCFSKDKVMTIIYKSGDEVIGSDIGNDLDIADAVVEGNSEGDVLVEASFTDASCDLDGGDKTVVITIASTAFR